MLTSTGAISDVATAISGWRRLSPFPRHSLREGSARSEQADGQKLEQLQRLDQQVRNRAKALRVGSERDAAGPFFRYQIGSDGKRYAVAEEARTAPEARLQGHDDDQVRREPPPESSRDRRVTAQAAALSEQRIRDLAAQRVQSEHVEHLPKPLPVESTDRAPAPGLLLDIRA